VQNSVQTVISRTARPIAEKKAKVARVGDRGRCLPANRHAAAAAVLRAASWLFQQIEFNQRAPPRIEQLAHGLAKLSGLFRLSTSGDAGVHFSTAAACRCPCCARDCASGRRIKLPTGRPSSAAH
jgi:hypothetical protein